MRPGVKQADKQNKRHSVTFAADLLFLLLLLLLTDERARVCVRANMRACASVTSLYKQTRVVPLYKVTT